MYLLDESSRLRHAVVWIIQWKWFERFILFVIFLNSLSLAIVDYSASSVDPSTWEPSAALSSRNKFVDSLEVYFIVVFTVESFLKIIGMGFVLDEGCYLRDPWNWLDFTVVMSG